MCQNTVKQRDMRMHWLAPADACGSLLLTQCAACQSYSSIPMLPHRSPCLQPPCELRPAGPLRRRRRAACWLPRPIAPSCGGNPKLFHLICTAYRWPLRAGRQLKWAEKRLGSPLPTRRPQGVQAASKGSSHLADSRCGRSFGSCGQPATPAGCLLPFQALWPPAAAPKRPLHRRWRDQNDARPTASSKSKVLPTPAACCAAQARAHVPRSSRPLHSISSLFRCRHTRFG